jgi:hypothetical protein
MCVLSEPGFPNQVPKRLVFTVLPGPNRNERDIVNGISDLGKYLDNTTQVVLEKPRVQQYDRDIIDPECFAGLFRVGTVDINAISVLAIRDVKHLFWRDSLTPDLCL